MEMPPQRSTRVPPVYNPIPFNFVDLEEKAVRYIAQVKAETAKIVSEAQIEIERLRQHVAAENEKATAELEQTRNQTREETETIRRQLNDLQQRLQTEEENFKTRKEQLENEASQQKARLKQDEESAKKTGYDEGKKAGYDEGHTQGYADGEMKATIDYSEKVQREAEIQLGTQLETLMPALSTMIDRLELAKQTFLQQWEKSVLKVAEAIAVKAIGRQLLEMIDVPVGLLREALELGTGSTSMRIRLNEEDYQALKPQIDMLIQGMTRSARTEIVGDPTISPGGCILETPQGMIDNRIESRIARIEEELCLTE